MEQPRRVPLVAGNWKMNTTVLKGVALAGEIRDQVGIVDIDVALLPPFTHLWPVHEALGHSRFLIGAQDAFWEQSGAFTGEISPTQLRGWCGFVLLGHSERRHQLGETDEQVGRKVRCALASGLKVMLAVGETKDERMSDETTAVLERQLDAAVVDVNDSDMDRCTIAYEPVWAIGTGDTASAAEAELMCAWIRSYIARKFSGDIAARMRILYGGSVTHENAAELFAEPDIDGALVGGASLDAMKFAAIVAAADSAYRTTA